MLATVSLVQGNLGKLMAFRGCIPGLGWHASEKNRSIRYLFGVFLGAPVCRIEVRLTDCSEFAVPSTIFTIVGLQLVAVHHEKLLRLGALFLCQAFDVGIDSSMELR